MRVFVVANGCLHGDRLFGDLEHLAHFIFGHVHALAEFFRRGLAAHLLQHLARDAVQLVDRLDHVHGNTNGAGLIRNRPRDGLTNPPGGVGRELVAAAIFEFIDRLHQTNVAFLNQIQKLQAAVGVLFGDRNHQAQVGFDHFFLGASGSGFAHTHAAIDFLDLGDGETRCLFYVTNLALQALNLFFVLIDARAYVFLARNTPHPTAVAL